MMTKKEEKERKKREKKKKSPKKGVVMEGIECQFCSGAQQACISMPLSKSMGDGTSKYLCSTIMGLIKKVSDEGV
jgi:hypothetical protein